MPSLREISNALGKNNFATSFTFSQLRRELKENYMEVGKARWELDHRVVDELMCFLEVGYSSFQRHVHLGAWKQWTWLA